jgi:hypothetical protein
MNSKRLQFLHSALDKAETRLKLATGCADWRGAIAAAEDAVAIEAELAELRAEAGPAPQGALSAAKATELGR